MNIPKPGYRQCKDMLACTGKYYCLTCKHDKNRNGQQYGWSHTYTTLHDSTWNQQIFMTDKHDRRKKQCRKERIILPGSLSGSEHETGTRKTTIKCI